jgi:hypothetical protein
MNYYPEWSNSSEVLGYEACKMSWLLSKLGRPVAQAPAQIASPIVKTKKKKRKLTEKQVYNYLKEKGLKVEKRKSGPVAPVKVVKKKKKKGKKKNKILPPVTSQLTV